MQIRIFRKTITFGYILIAVLIGSIAYTSFYEWRKLEALEEENRQIDRFRLRLHDAYVRMIEFSCSEKPYWNGRTRTWNTTIRNAWQWTVCCAVSRRPARRNGLTACASCWKTRKHRCGTSCRFLNSKPPSTRR